MRSQWYDNDFTHLAKLFPDLKQLELEIKMVSNFTFLMYRCRQTMLHTKHIHQHLTHS